jgi:hypothetical protein
MEAAGSSEMYTYLSTETTLWAHNGKIERDILTRVSTP